MSSRLEGVGQLEIDGQSQTAEYLIEYSDRLGDKLADGQRGPAKRSTRGRFTNASLFSAARRAEGAGKDVWLVLEDQTRHRLTFDFSGTFSLISPSN
jgi:hypothetical protein